MSCFGAFFFLFFFFFILMNKESSYSGTRLAFPKTVPISTVFVCSSYISMIESLSSNSGSENMVAEILENLYVLQEEQRRKEGRGRRRAPSL